MTYNPESATHQGAVEIAVTWLSSLHRKGWQNAFMNLYQELLSEDDLAKLAMLDADVIQSIEININGNYSGRIRVDGSDSAEVWLRHCAIECGDKCLENIGTLLLHGGAIRANNAIGLRSL